MSSFVPLHVHSQYSFLEGASKVPDLIATAKANNWPAIALTDNGVLHGAIEFYSAAKAAGITPILGCEFYVVEGDITDRQSRQPTMRLVLLAQNLTGYRNLVKLVTTSHLEGFYYKPRVNWALLEQHTEGLVALSGGLSGVLAYPFMRGDETGMRANAEKLKALYGERAYIELQDHGHESYARYNQAAVALAQNLQMPLVAAHDNRFTQPDDFQVHTVLLCLQSGKTLNESERAVHAFGPNYHLKPGEAIAEALMAYLPEDVVAEAMANTANIAEDVTLELPLGQTLLPDYPIEAGETPTTALTKVAYEFAQKTYEAPSQEALPEEVRNRLDFELGIISQMGFEAYFLIVWDFIHQARSQGIPVGPGRGSAAGSLVAYVLGITHIDPLEHNLLFERFLNPERVSMPDIDIDFCIERRDEVIRYVTERYGTDRVCQIATFGTFAARAALKAVARVMEVPYADSDRLAKLIPFGPGIKLSDALAKGQPLGQLYNEGDPKVPNLKQVVDTALALEGTVFNLGTHAAGVIISKDPLTDWVPLQYSKDGQVISQYPMGDLERLGLLKMDFLGLRNLTIIHKTMALLPGVDIDKVPLDDPAVYEMLSQADTDGVFQLESGGMRALVRDLRPTTFEDINALVALYRPGPLNSGMVKTFVNRKHGREKVVYEHPLLEPILKDTYGTIVYQEQIMQIAQQLAGYSLGQADLLRRAMGKKKAEVMAKEREGFLEGAASNGIEARLAEKLFDTMSEFAAYCFNRSHSAAYALVAYQTAWLKRHHPVAYMSALLSSVRNDRDKTQQYLTAARRMGLAVKPPNINRSGLEFTPDEGSIRFGLASIKNVGVGAVEAILEARKAGPFADLADFCCRVSPKVLNRKTLESLILCGALDCFGIPRRKLLHNVAYLADYAQKQAERRESGQMDLFGALAGGGNDTSADTPANGELWLAGDDTELTDDDIQAYERDLLGFYVSSHPLDGIAASLPLMVSHTVAELTETPDETVVIVGGLLTAADCKQTKSGRTICVGMLEDLTGSIEFVAFQDTLDKAGALLVANQRVMLSGKLQRRGDEGEQVSVVVQEVWPADGMRPAQVRFREPPRWEALASLGRLLGSTPGRTPVILAWPDGSRYKVGSRFWIDAAQMEQLSSQAREQLGVELALASN